MNAPVVNPGKGQKAMSTLFSVAQDENKGVNILWPDNSFTPLAGTMDVAPATSTVSAVCQEPEVATPVEDVVDIDDDAEALIGPDTCDEDPKGPKHLGLIVAINDYPNCPLRGCLTDGQQNATEATSNYKFHAINMRLVFNRRADTKAILDRLNWLVSSAKPGDTIFFAYSGHGASIQDRAPSGRVRGVRECICPVDFDWSPERMITDQQFVDIFGKLPKGVKFLWISDSCHSGGLDREIPRHNNSLVVKIPRLYPAPFDIRWGVEAAKAAGLGHSKAIRAFVNGELEVAFVPGCKANQTSADTEINGVPCGALTHYFWDTVHSLPKTATTKEIVDAARNNLASDGYDQEPFASGALADKVLPLIG